MIWMMRCLVEFSQNYNSFWWGGKLKWDVKIKGRLEGDHATHLLGWIEKPIAWNSIWKCSYVNDTIKGGPMMWMSSIMDGIKQKRNDWL
jgi:hypothetical protein